MNYQGNMPGQVQPMYPGNQMSYNQYGQYSGNQMNQGRSAMPYNGQSYQSIDPSYGYSQNQQIPSAAEMSVDWIQGGLPSARAYPKPQPGHAVILIDPEADLMFVKKTDPTGFPLPLKAFVIYDKPIEELERQSNSQSSMPDMSNYLTKDDFKMMLEQYLGPVGKENK